MKAVRNFLTSAAVASLGSAAWAQSSPPNLWERVMPSAGSKTVLGPVPPKAISPSELSSAGPVGAAAKVRQDRAGAERIKAVQYLATVDCHYWPEAEEAFIHALRADRNEAVRYEAAVALAKGCCRTPKVVVALSNAVGCSTDDGGFQEMSVQVRFAAMTALEKCMPCCAVPDLPNLEIDGGKKSDGERPKLSAEDHMTVEMKAYYAKVGKMPKPVVMTYATKAMDIGRRMGGSRMTTPSNAMDLAAAGVNGQASNVAPGRPENLWDKVTGQEPSSASLAHAQPTMRAGSVSAPAKHVAATMPSKTLAVAASQPKEPPVKKVAAVVPVPTPAKTKTPPKPAEKTAPKLAAKTTEKPAPKMAAKTVEKPAPKVERPSPAPAAVASRMDTQTLSTAPKPAVASRTDTRTLPTAPKPIVAATSIPMVKSMADSSGPSTTKVATSVNLPPRTAPAILPVSIPASTPVKPALVAASPAEKKQTPMAMTSMEPTPVEPAGIARVVSLPLPKAAEPVAVVAQPAPTVVPVSSQTFGIMPEPISIRPAIPARR